ncbi:hypothetical protein DFJ43DRAFT_1059834 [Lentinula guzmanii]|uniref:F-box domain-containing protein n=1 Tax=Lentinula guzmanii TaxID=2804957 RepID=A0AA38JQZ2_9AGAR|nr:hypothetical protein DFJ43DRAFT_1059834 [Lentinula guzmanii]
MPATLPEMPRQDPDKPVKSSNQIDSLPNELLAKIFRAGIELDRNDESPRSLITYCGVNSRWLAICHHSPALWTDIRIPLYHTHPQAIVARTATWLERSKSCPFDLTLVITIAMLTIGIVSNAEPYDEFRLIRDILSVLIPHIPRVQRLFFTTEISFSSREVLFICTRLAAYEAPHLTDIRLRFGTLDINEYVISMDRIVPVVFRSAPCLRRQSLYGADMQYPLRGLTSLELSHVLPDEASFRYLSAQSPALEELCLLSLHPMVNAADLTQSKLSFPALRSLTVSFARRTFAPGTSVLALMSPPNLELLRIQGIFLPNPATSFPNPTLLTQLHTLILEQVVFGNPNLPDANWHDTSFYLTLTSVRHLQLIDTPPQPLFPKQEAKRKPLLRSRSSELRVRSSDSHLDSQPVQAKELDSSVLSKQPLKLPFSPPANTSLSKPRTSNSYTYWPNLTTISLDTIRAKDLLWLCELIAERPEIETVYLSRSAKRHLASSLTMWRGEDVISSWDVNLKWKNLVRTRPPVEEGDMDPVEWLEQHVEVHDYHAKDQAF